MLEVPSIRVPDGEDGGYTIELDWDKIEENVDTTQKLTESERLENDWVIEAYDMIGGLNQHSKILHTDMLKS